MPSKPAPTAGTDSRHRDSARGQQRPVADRIRLTIALHPGLVGPMSVGLRTERCEDCGHQVPAFDTIDLTVSPKQSRRICARCFNALIAKRAGVRFEHPNFAPIVLQDAAGAPHEFHFRTRHGGDLQQRAGHPHNAARIANPRL
jgi:hypothetical protein